MKSIEKEILTDISKGIPLKDTLCRLNISTRKYYGTVQKHNIQTKRKKSLSISKEYLEGCYIRGKSISTISEELNISNVTTRRKCKKYNVPWHNQDLLGLNLIKKEYYENLLTMTEISKKYNVSFGLVYKSFEFYGLKRRKYSLDVYKKDNNTLIKIKNLYESGYPLNEIYSKFNIGSQILKSMISEFSFERKTNYRNVMDYEFYQNFSNNFSNTDYITVSKNNKISPITIRKRLKELNIVENYSPSVRRSSYENEICQFLDELNIEYQTNNKQILDNKYELDIYIQKDNKAIEFNGSYWHSDLHKHKKYHQDKFMECKSRGISLYQIYEHDWKQNKEKIKNDLKVFLIGFENTVYARNCTIKEIEANVCRNFLQKYHIQGNSPAKFKLGLFHGDLLVSVMTFSTPRFDTKNEYELIRYCSNRNVIGGSQKLLKRFIRDYSPESIVSYSLNDRGYNNFYKNLGFDYIDTTPPNYMWTDGTNIKSRYQCQKHKLNTELSETQYMGNSGFYRVFNAGNSKYVWNK